MRPTSRPGSGSHALCRLRRRRSPRRCGESSRRRREGVLRTVFAPRLSGPSSPPRSSIPLVGTRNDAKKGLRHGGTRGLLLSDECLFQLLLLRLVSISIHELPYLLNL